ncbi:MAG TPA: M1 family aminopeptidase [Sandaracinaceae bacterium LLY-WYZ-13_1]|nr:M1 family aminopeptidase [Sandaracinaceae bacterium LLY-WYZ-13_1]
MHHRHLCAHACRFDSPTGGARPFRLPGDRPQWARPRPFSLDALRLEVALDLDARAVDATAHLTIRRVDPDARWVSLDAIAFDLAGVERARDGHHEPAAHDYDGERLRVDLSDVPDGGEAAIRVRYRAHPRRGLYFMAPDETNPERPRQVWSQCQDQDARHWIPCQDHPGQRMRTEIEITVPKGWFALSNGELVERVDEGEGTRFHWRQPEPHPAYLITLATGELDEAHDEAGEVPIDYYVPKGRGEQIERSLGRTPEMVKLFSEKLRTPYPWSKYAQIVVTDFIFGGMENTSATTLFERALLDERAALDVDVDALVSHELAHQWFGDLVTCRHWSHAWLNEGFATYMEHVWKEHHEGLDAYYYNLEADLEIYLKEHRGRYGRPVVEKVWATPIDVFDRHLYQKGGLVLHALRQHLGDEAFWRGLAFYLERHRGGSVETRDLLRALEDATGRSLEELFHQWIERAGHPELEVAIEHGEAILKVTVTQKQAEPKDDEGAFHLRLPIQVTTEAGTEEEVLDVTRATETFALPCEAPPIRVVIDPAMTAPGVVEPKVPTKMLVDQLAHAEPARPRWCAARALGKKNEPRAVEALAESLAEDPFWGVRVEAAEALGEQRTDAAFEALGRAEGDDDPRVRRAVASALGKWRMPAAADRLLAWIERGDESYLVEAALRRSLGATRDPRGLEVLSRSLKEDVGSWGEIVRAAAAEGLGALADPAAVEPLLAILDEPTTAATVRRSVLGALGKARDTVSDRPTLRRIRERAEQELDCFDPNVRIAVAKLMAALADGAGIAVLDRMIERELDGRVRRASREARRDLRAAQQTPPEVTALRDEVDGLRREVGRLRDQVASAQARTRADAEG